MTSRPSPIAQAHGERDVSAKSNFGPEPVLDGDPDGATVRAVIDSLWNEPTWCLEAVALAAFRAGKADRSLRDWFAGKALAGLCANPELLKQMPKVLATQRGSDIDHAFARMAANYADAMLAERERKS